MSIRQWPVLASLLVLCFSVSLRVQAQTFAGFLVAGGTVNQVQGDDLAGYNRLGGLAGVGVYNDLSDRWRWSLTIAYAQHGSSASAREALRQRSAFDKIDLSYVSVPVSLHYMDWLSADETFYHLEFILGATYNRLLSSEVTGIFGDDLTDTRPYADNVVAVNVGAYYAWSLKWAAGIVHTRGISDAQALAGEQRQFLEQLAFQVRRTL